MPVPKANQCGATRRNGEICKGDALRNGRCKWHGGGSNPPGPTHPNWIHGRYSKMRDYPGIEFTGDTVHLKEVLDMTTDIQMMYGRIDFLMKQQISSPDDHDNWPFIRALLLDLKSMKLVAMRIQDKTENQIAQNQIEQLFERVGIAVQRTVKDEATRNKLIMQIVDIVGDATKSSDDRIEDAIAEARELEQAGETDE